MNERDFSHIVELAVPEGGFGRALDAIHDFHRLRGIESRRGRLQRRNDQEFVRWCFASVIDAEFAGTLVQAVERSAGGRR